MLPLLVDWGSSEAEAAHVGHSGSAYPRNWE